MALAASARALPWLAQADRLWERLHLRGCILRA
jgi:hypothetical protein